MKVELTKPKTIVLVEEKIQTLETITIKRMADFPIEKKVVVFIEELQGAILLWEGEEYDKIGEWTNSDVIDRLKELYS
jgi:hypothetical protein